MGGSAGLGGRVLSKGLVELGERVRKRRIELRWSQEKLAEMAGVSLNTVSRVEGGQSDMSIEVFRKLANSLGVSASELLGEIGSFQGDWQMQRLLHQIDNLGQGEKEVVLRTLNTLIEAIGICHEKKYTRHCE
jgi:transcriptional regulator with XRE-family HTH domain